MPIRQIHVTTSWLEQNTTLRNYKEKMGKTPKKLENSVKGFIQGADALSATFEQALHCTYETYSSDKKHHRLVASATAYIGNQPEGTFNEPLLLSEAIESEETKSLWLRTDENAEELTTVNQGILFANESQAIEFGTMYPTISHFYASKAYESHEGYLFLSSHTAKHFERELHSYVEQIKSEKKKGSKVLVNPLPDIKATIFDAHSFGDKHSLKSPDKSNWVVVAIESRATTSLLLNHFSQSYKLHKVLARLAESNEVREIKRKPGFFGKLLGKKEEKRNKLQESPASKSM